MTALGWGLASLPLILAVYAYVAYPAILWALARRPSDAARSARAKPPLVTVVVPAYNEEAQIRGAIEAILAQKYPADRRQILVLSDASTDATDDIVREYSARGVELHRMPARAGKTAEAAKPITVVRNTVLNRVFPNGPSRYCHRSARTTNVPQVNASDSSRKSVRALVTEAHT